MPGKGLLKTVAWTAAMLGGLLSVERGVAQQPTVARGSAAATPARPGITRPPAILSAPLPSEQRYEVPAPQQLTSQQTSGAQPLRSRVGEVGTGVRPASFQESASAEPYYTMPGTRIERLPPPIGSQPMTVTGPTAEHWPGGEVLQGHAMHSGYAMQGNAPCNPACDPCCYPPPLIGLPQLGSVELLAGVHGFTGPLNRGSGSFGFHQGAQVGMPVFGCASAEFGVLTTQNNFEGSPLTSESRNQLFLTAGGFRRVDWGLQGGLAFDYLHDEWDYSVDLAQLRGELSYVLPCGHDIGAWFTVGVNDAHSDLNMVVPVTGGPVIVDSVHRNFDVQDVFAFFYRRQFVCGGEGRAFGGFTSDGAGLFGGDFRFPINSCWAFEADFMYVTATSESIEGFADESWNVSMQVVWTPWSRSCGKNYNRPLLGVANNGLFLTKIK